MINERDIRRWYDIVKGGNQLTEVRIFQKNPKRTYSGYFTDIETLLNCIRPFDSCDIYFTLNNINDACYTRDQKNCILEHPDATTSDKDIVGRDWVMLDMDVERPKGTNSSEEEFQAAKAVANNIVAFLRDEGFNRPIVCTSGNGVHLLYKTAMKNTDENTETVKKFLQVMNMYFCTEKVKIDTSVFNASRICRLYGCTNHKGRNTEERPQRVAEIIQVPGNIAPTPKEYFEKIAGRLPQPPKADRFSGYSSEKFDLDSFIREHNIEVHNIASFGDGRKIVLEHCPFNPEHRHPDAAIFQFNNGAIAFKCLHASCAHYTWRDVRLLFDPQAYDRKDYEEFRARRDYYSTKPKPTPTITEESSEKGAKWLSMSSIRFVDPRQFIYIPTGIQKLDDRMGGLALGDVTIVSGLAGAGKSTLIDGMMLTAVTRGYKCAIWSGELQDFRFLQWIDQIAAGRGYVALKEGSWDWWYCPKAVADRINRWLDGKLWLYNNDYGNHFSQIFSDVKDCVAQNGTQLIVLDNLMSLSLDSYSGDKNEKQAQFINELKAYAKQANIAIILVCHPRKEMSNALLRMESISGTADLANLADNILLAHRVGKDFERRATEFFGTAETQEYMHFDEVIEVAKNRSHGMKDLKVGLYYEKETRRFKNEVHENVVFGWQDPSTETVPQHIYTFEDMPDFG